MHGCTGTIYSLLLPFHISCDFHCYVQVNAIANEEDSINTETQNYQERNYQLPPLKNVPEGCWSTEESRAF